MDSTEFEGVVRKLRKETLVHLVAQTIGQDIVRDKLRKCRAIQLPSAGGLGCHPCHAAAVVILKEGS